MTSICRCLWTSVVVVTLAVICVNAELSELTEAWSCYDQAHESAANYPPLPGGYGEVNDPSSNERVMSVSRLAMARLNNVADDSYVISTSTNDGLIAFLQVSGSRSQLRFYSCFTTSTTSNNPSTTFWIFCSQSAEDKQRWNVQTFLVVHWHSARRRICVVLRLRAWTQQLRIAEARTVSSVLHLYYCTPAMTSARLRLWRPWCTQKKWGL